MRLIRNSVLGVCVLAALAVAPTAVFADDHGVPITGSFTVLAARPAAPSPITGPYCAGGIGTPFEAQGIGSVSKLGPMFLTVKKCLTVVNGQGTYVGTFTMTAGDGDTLEGRYDGTVVLSSVDENGFRPFQGTLTFTGGTGRFVHARGALSFTAVASPLSTGVTVPTANLMAFYLVQGNMVSPGRN